MSDSPANTVTIQAPQGRKIAQMYERITKISSVVKEIPNGTLCEKVSGPTPVTIDGVHMYFYEIAYEGVTGFVNAKWVRE